MKTIQKFLQAFLVVAALLLIDEKSMGQTLNSFTVEIQHATPGQTNGKIYINVSEAAGAYTFKLFDLYDQTKEFKQVIENKYMSVGKKELVFSGLPPSGYVIQVTKDRKKWMLGGMNGFIIQ